MNWIAILSYFLNVKNFLVKTIETASTGSINHTLITFLVSLGIFLFIQIVISLIFVPEKLKYPSYVGCVILALCVFTFWYLNLLSSPNNFNNMKAFIDGSYMSLAAKSFFGVESITSYFVMRSSMKKKSSFYSVRLMDVYMIIV